MCRRYPIKKKDKSLLRDVIEIFRGVFVDKYKPEMPVRLVHEGNCQIHLETKKVVIKERKFWWKKKKKM